MNFIQYTRNVKLFHLGLIINVNYLKSPGEQSFSGIGDLR